VRHLLLPLTAAGLFLTGCYPGEVQTADGSFKLRGALHLVQTTDTPRMIILLSDSQFECDISSDNSGEVLNSMGMQLASIGREGAQTLLMRATKLDAGEWNGEYPVEPYDSVLWSGRWSEALYLRIDESTVSASEILPYEYNATEFTQMTSNEDGELTLQPTGDDGQMKGSFNFRDIEISGEFTSTICELDDGTMQAVIRQIEQFLQDNNIDADQAF